MARGATIEPYAQANRENHEPTRDRKLLLKRPEIERLASRVAERGLTIVPTRLYFRNGKAKVEIALAKGKEGRDKRQAIADREMKRELDRALKARRR